MDRPPVMNLKLRDITLEELGANAPEWTRRQNPGYERGVVRQRPIHCLGDVDDLATRTRCTAL